MAFPKHNLMIKFQKVHKFPHHVCMTCHHYNTIKVVKELEVIYTQNTFPERTFPPIQQTQGDNYFHILFSKINKNIVKIKRATILTQLCHKMPCHLRLELKLRCPLKPRHNFWIEYRSRTLCRNRNLPIILHK